MYTNMGMFENYSRFDTHAAIKALIQTGVKEDQAEALVKIVNDSKDMGFNSLASKEQVSLLKKDFENLSQSVANKADLFEVRRELEEKIHSAEKNLEGKMNSMEKRLEEKIHVLEEKMNSMEKRLETKIDQVREEVSAIRTEIASAQTTMLKWYIATALITLSLFAGGLGMLLRILKLV